MIFICCAWKLEFLESIQERIVYSLWSREVKFEVLWCEIVWVVFCSQYCPKIFFETKQDLMSVLGFFFSKTTEIGFWLCFGGRWKGHDRKICCFWESWDIRWILLYKKPKKVRYNLTTYLIYFCLVLKYSLSIWQKNINSSFISFVITFL